MRRRILSITLGPIASLTMLAATATPASAASWVTSDRDNMALAVPSGRAFTSPAVIAWRHEAGYQLYEDKNAHWSATLVRQGKGCARLQVITYKKATGGDTTPSVSKRWPAAGTTKFGYYSICGSKGAKKRFEGGDTLSNRPGRQHVFDRVEWRVCFAPSAGTPCTQTVTLVRHPGD